MVDRSFFDESSEQSWIKRRIVAKYFWAWAKVILSARGHRPERIAYVDLFAGPGRYADGAPSTPVMVLQEAIKEPRLRETLVTLFNDKDEACTQCLQRAITAITGVEKLKYEPKVTNEEVGTNLVEALAGVSLVPTLLFVDPWGYKGLSLALINSFLRNWGCDCIFFFNYNRINPGLDNVAVRGHMNDLFGGARADAIRRDAANLSPDERETLIIEGLAQALKEMGAKYVLPFTFKNERGTRTKQHLIFVSKDPTGYKIMKEIMAGESSERDQGVASFAYSPASQKYPTLFELSRPLDDLEEMLMRDFAGQRLTMAEVFERHNVGRPYIQSNYKKALAKLEARGRIQADPPAQKRRKVKGELTFGDNVVITFPEGEARR